MDRTIELQECIFEVMSMVAKEALHSDGSVVGGRVLGVCYFASKQWALFRGEGGSALLSGDWRAFSSDMTRFRAL